MPQTITKGFREMLDEAEREIETLSVEEAQQAARQRRCDASSTCAIRASASAKARCRAHSIARAACWSSGSTRRARITSRNSPRTRSFVFFCAGGWRSALAAQTAHRMGLKPVAHIRGGFGEWKKSGAPVELPEAKPKA